jgi:hypothetical protein
VVDRGRTEREPPWYTSESAVRTRPPAFCLRAYQLYARSSAWRRLVRVFDYAMAPPRWARNDVHSPAPAAAAAESELVGVRLLRRNNASRPGCNRAPDGLPRRGRGGLELGSRRRVDA